MCNGQYGNHARMAQSSLHNVKRKDNVIRALDMQLQVSKAHAI